MLVLGIGRLDNIFSHKLLNIKMKVGCMKSKAQLCSDGITDLRSSTLELFNMKTADCLPRIDALIIKEKEDHVQLADDASFIVIDRTDDRSE